MKKTTRKVIASVLCLCLMLSLSVTAFASDYTLGRSYTWSPYTSSNTVTTYTNSIRAYHQFFFDKDGADAINSWLYFTMEQNCGDGNALALDVQYSNLPDAHFDTDDDDEDGYEEESEVVMGISGTVNSSTYYYFTTWWDSDGAVDAGYVDFIAQRSALNPFNGEYEALTYDLLTQLSYGALSRSSMTGSNRRSSDTVDAMSEANRIDHTNDGYAEIVEENANKKTVTIMPLIESISDVNNFAQTQTAKIAELRQERATVSARGNLNNNAKATVTFNGAISLADLNNILAVSGAEFIDCELKLLDENGTWITANIRDLQTINTTEKIANLENAVAADAGTTVDYCGITSARLYLNIMDNSFEMLSNDSRVYFVDMMDEIIRQEYKDYDGELKVRVFDMAWMLANENN